MLWQVDPTASRPLHEQVAASVRRAIAQHEVRRGDRLPAAREVAASLGINVHTVLRAYQTLRDEGLIELRRGRGAVVTADHPGFGDLHRLADELIDHAGRLGLDRSELVALIDRVGREPSTTTTTTRSTTTGTTTGTTPGTTTGE